MESERDGERKREKESKSCRERPRKVFESEKTDLCTMKRQATQFHGHLNM